jgi:ankyrin repeat protein
MAAASEGKEQLVALLLRAGADVAIRDSRQQTASMLARGNGHDVLAASLELPPPPALGILLSN